MPFLVHIQLQQVSKPAFISEQVLRIKQLVLQKDQFLFSSLKVVSIIPLLPPPIAQA